jgi:hypothetical protein
MSCTGKLPATPNCNCRLVAHGWVFDIIAPHDGFVTATLLLVQQSILLGARRTEYQAETNSTERSVPLACQRPAAAARSDAMSH